MNKQQFTKQVLEAEASLYHVAHTLLVNEEDCADAIQNAILAAYDKLGDLKKDAYFKTWLTRILINECYRILRVDSFHYNRPLTETERSRFDTLNQSYEEEGMFPKGALTVLESPEAYKGKGVGFYETRSTFFLPEQELTDEELLQLIDFYHQVNYSLQKVGGQIKQGAFLTKITSDHDFHVANGICRGKDGKVYMLFEDFDRQTVTTNTGILRIDLEEKQAVVAAQHFLPDHEAAYDVLAPGGNVLLFHRKLNEKSNDRCIFEQ